MQFIHTTDSQSEATKRLHQELGNSLHVEECEEELVSEADAK